MYVFKDHGVNIKKPQYKLITSKIFQGFHTSSKSSTFKDMPATSFHMQGAKCRSKGFFVLIATPNSMPRNLNNAAFSSTDNDGFSKYLRIQEKTRLLRLLKTKFKKKKKKKRTSMDKTRNITYQGCFLNHF